MSKYFIPTPTTLEELKALYRSLCMVHHPDRGGDTATMQTINAEYDTLFDRVKTIHRNQSGETYTKATDETADYFRDIIDALLRLRMQGVTIELIGSFLWLSGNTKVYRTDIKALNFKWSTNKTAWYLAPEGYRKRSRRDFTMGDIRTMFGSENIDNEPAAQPALA